jgi:hypothetical protein
MFIPDRLGASTTIAFNLTVTGRDRQPPSALTHLDLHLPAGIGLLESTLGLASCNRTTLLRRGLAGCSTNARVGVGHARVKLAYETGTIEAHANVTALLGVSQREGIPVLFYFDVLHPVYGRFVLSGEMVQDSSPFGEQLVTSEAPIAIGPEGPDVAITRLNMTLGPLGLTYYRRIHGRTVAFEPKGFSVPTSCPRAGFPFAADLTFVDGTHVRARSAVPCPGRSGHVGRPPRSGRRRR